MAVTCVAAIGISACGGGAAADHDACAYFFDVEAEVTPILQSTDQPVVDNTELSQPQHEVLRQWTYDLADASQMAAAEELRVALRRAADLAHDVYTGAPAAVEEYRDWSSRAQSLCA